MIATTAATYRKTQCFINTKPRTREPCPDRRNYTSTRCHTPGGLNLPTEPPVLWADQSAACSCMLAVSLCHSYCSYRRPRYSVTQHGRSATQNIGNHRQILTAAAILTAVFVGSTIFQLQKLKDKCTVHPITGQAAPEGEYRYCSTLSSTSVLDVGGWSTLRPGRFTPWKTLYPLYRRLGGSQGQSGRVRKISPPPGFDPRTVQPVANHYTDCAIPARNNNNNNNNNNIHYQPRACTIHG